MSEQSLVPCRKWLFWLCMGFCCLAVSACGGNTVTIHDNAHVLNTLAIHNAASDLSQNVSIYTFNDFHGKQQDFYPSVVQKFGTSPNTILLVIDTVHPSLYVLRGASVSLSRSDISQAASTFKETYTQEGYTNATISTLNVLKSALNANHSSPFSPLLWIIPLILFAGAFLLLFLRTRRRVR